MKQLQKTLQSISKSLQALAVRVESIQKQVGGLEEKNVKTKAKPVRPKPVKKATRIKPAKQPESGTAYSIFLKAVEDSENGISKAALKVKTGFNDKKIANLVYMAKKQGKIKAVSKGVHNGMITWLR